MIFIPSSLSLEAFAFLVFLATFSPQDFSHLYLPGMLAFLRYTYFPDPGINRVKLILQCIEQSKVQNLNIATKPLVVKHVFHIPGAFVGMVFSDDENKIAPFGRTELHLTVGELKDD